MLHHDNPAQRSPAPLERYLEQAKEISQKELSGDIKTIQEGPKVTRASCVQLSVAVLSLMARSSPLSLNVTLNLVCFGKMKIAFYVFVEGKHFP